MLEKAYFPKTTEQDFQEIWQNSARRRACLDEEKKPYTIMMPPPNVTGALHLGHALTYTLQDILVRYKRMQGFDVLWQPGLDHAGIATQMVVEKKLLAKGIDPKTLSDEEFLEAIWAWKEESGGGIFEQLKRLGASADWERARFTMDEGMSQAVRTVFIDLYDQGLIYKAKRLVNWDPHLQTAISDIEVEQRDVKGHLWYIRYPLEEGGEESLVVATSRPETVFGDTAIAVHPEDPRYSHLIGKRVIHPLLKTPIVIIGDTYCDMEKGTGAVKITPAHDFNDFEVGLRANLEQVNIFTADGRLNDQVPHVYQSLDRFEAREQVIRVLESEGYLEKVEETLHSVPYGDRSGVPIEPRLTDQWYLKTEELSQKAIEAVEKKRTQFVPEQWTETFYRWMKNIQPWCLSRQIRWGHRIPAWYGPDGQIFVAESASSAQKKADLFYKKSVALEEEKDVLDTWFSSALWPFSTLGWPNATPELDRYYPTDVLVTGFDIIFFWVARMIMMGLHFTQEVPFKKVYINAIVRDEKGQKMSKSKGNVLDPLVLMDKYGADALRFTLTLYSIQGRDVKISDQRVETSRNFITKIWNFARFLELNECVRSADFNPSKVSHPLCIWLVEEAARLTTLIDEAIESFKFNEYALTLQQGIRSVFCDWGVEFAKCEFHNEASPHQEEIRSTLAWSFEVLLKLMHPIMPFISEELSRSLVLNQEALPRKILMESDWPILSSTVGGGDIKESFDHLQELIGDIRATRSILGIPPKDKIVLCMDVEVGSFNKRYGAYKDYIMTLARLSEIKVEKSTPGKTRTQFLFEGMTLALDFGDSIDFEAQKDRLEKEYSKVTQELRSVEQRLENKDFLKRAPSEIVEELSLRREKLNQELEKRARLVNGPGVSP